MKDRAQRCEFHPRRVRFAGLDKKPDWGVVEGLVKDAYRLVATKKLVARL